jgi:hypothetical protein
MLLIVFRNFKTLIIYTRAVKLKSEKFPSPMMGWGNSILDQLLLLLILLAPLNVPMS